MYPIKQPISTFSTFFRQSNFFFRTQQVTKRAGFKPRSEHQNSCFSHIVWAQLTFPIIFGFCCCYRVGQLYFSGQFGFMENSGRNYREFPYLPSPLHAQFLSHYHLALVRYICYHQAIDTLLTEVHSSHQGSICVIHSVGFSKCIMSGIHVQCHGECYCPQNAPCSIHSFLSPPRPSANY